VPQRPIQTRRGNFQRVGLPEILLAELIFDIEQRAQILADALTVRDADTVFDSFDPARRRAVDHDTQHHPDRFAAELDVENLESVTPRHPLGGTAKAIQLFGSRRTGP
jgi:hypothetical protein